MKITTELDIKMPRDSLAREFHIEDPPNQNRAFILVRPLQDLNVYEASQDTALAPLTITISPYARYTSSTYVLSLGQLVEKALTPLDTMMGV